MAKLLLNGIDCWITPSRFAEVLENFGISCDRKKNGHIWVKSLQRSSDAYFDAESAVREIVKEQGDIPGLPHIGIHNLRLMFFDHICCFTDDEGYGVAMFSPYHCENTWPKLIPYMWEKGFYVAVYSRKECGSLNYVALVRKRKEKDTMFVFTHPYGI